MYQVRTKFPPVPKPAKAANSAKAQNGDLKSIPEGPAKAAKPANVDRAGFSNFSGFSGYPEGEKKSGTGFSRFSNFSGLPGRGKNTPSPVSILRRAGLVPVLAGDSFEVLGLENLPDDRRERCRQYCREHEREILQELRDEAWFRGGFHLSWFRDVGLELALDDSGMVVWTVVKGWEKLWDVKQGALPTRSKRALPVDCEWQCWRYACKHRREIMAALQPCRGWKPSQPSGGCTTLEEFTKRAGEGTAARCVEILSVPWNVGTPEGLPEMVWPVDRAADGCRAGVLGGGAVEE